MKINHLRLSTRRAPLLAVAAAACGLTLLGGMAWAALNTPVLQVTQKGRTFRPGEITINRGQTVEFVNDDGDLLHHAYLSSDKFSFDTGDQEPNTKNAVVFTEAGTFNVLCGIHPKMKLVVHVN
jgi:plastocyanin